MQYLQKPYHIWKLHTNLNAEDKNTLLSLKQLYYLNSDYAKSEEMKKLIAELK